MNQNELKDPKVLESIEFALSFSIGNLFLGNIYVLNTAAAKIKYFWMKILWKKKGIKVSLCCLFVLFCRVSNNVYISKN